MCCTFVPYSSRKETMWLMCTHTHTHTQPQTHNTGYRHCCLLISYLVHHLIDAEVTLEEPQLSPDLIPKLACSPNLLCNLLCLACLCKTCTLMHRHTETHKDTHRHMHTHRSIQNSFSCVYPAVQSPPLKELELMRS